MAVRSDVWPLVEAKGGRHQGHGPPRAHAQALNLATMLLTSSSDGRSPFIAASTISVPSLMSSSLCLYGVICMKATMILGNPYLAISGVNICVTSPINFILAIGSSEASDS